VPLPQTTVVPANPVAVTPAPDAPKRVRFEVFSSSSGKADISVGSDNVDRERLNGASTPWAVEADFPSGARYFSLSASSLREQPRPDLACRIYLDGVLIHQDQARSSVTCTIYMPQVLRP